MGFVIHPYDGLERILLSVLFSVCLREFLHMHMRVCDWVIECVCTIHCSGLSDSL